MTSFKNFIQKRLATDLSEKKKGLNHFFACIYVLVFILFSNSVSADTVITNTATANFSVNSSAQQLSDSVQFTKDTVVVPPDEITLAKEVNVTSAEIGAQVTYTLTVKNPNNSDLDNVLISDILPAGLTYIANSSKLNSTTIPNTDITYTGNLLTFSLGTIPANTTWSVSYKLKALSKGIKVNKATVSSLTANSEIAQVSINITEPLVIPTIPLSISKQSNKNKVAVGDVIGYNISINNPNNKAINNTILHDNLPNGLAYVAGSAVLNGLSISVNTGGGLTFNLGTIPANTSWTLSYDTVLKSKHGNTLVNSANIISDDAAANSNTSSSTVEISDDKILINKVADKTSASVGDLVLYTIKVSNPEDHILSNIIVRDVLPEGFDYQIGTATLNNISVPDSAIQVIDNQLLITIQSLAIEESTTITYQLLVTDSAPLGNAINTVHANSDLAQSTASSATVKVVSPTLPITLEKSTDITKVKQGDIIEYLLIIENPNTKTIDGITVNDFLPDGVQYIKESALLNDVKVNAITDSGLAFQLSSIPAKTKWFLSYKVEVINTTGLEKLTNKANITTKNGIANSSTVTATVDVSNDKIHLTKLADKAKAMFDDTILYTITVENPENHSINNIKVNDTLPLGFIYKEGSATLDGNTLNSSNVQFNNRNLVFLIDSIDQQKTHTLRYKVIVGNTAKIGDSTNIVQANSDFAISNTASAVVKIRTPSTINFYKINENGVKSVIEQTAYNNNQDGGKHWQEVGDITLTDGTTIQLPNEQPLVEATQYTLLDPIVIEVIDLDQNTDPTVKDTIIIVIGATGTSDTEVLLLQETTANSGIFVGIITTTTDLTETHNGVLSLQQGESINVTYRDEEDSTDNSASAALVTPNTLITLNKVADKDTASIGEQVRYTLTFNNDSGFSIPNLNLVDTLPLGFRYVPNTLALNGELVDINVENNGRVLKFLLGKMPLGATWTLEYLTRITAGVQIGNAINVAIIDSGKFTSNEARASVKIIDELMRTKNILTGRVYLGCNKGKDSIVLDNIRIFSETGRSILTDKNGFWHMEGVQPGTHVLQVDSDSLPSGYEPVICQGNTRLAGSAYSQFVDLIPGTLWQVDFHLKKTASTQNSQEITKAINDTKLNPVTLFDKKYLKNAPEGFEILWPKNNYVPEVASTKIFIKSSPKHKIEVFLNGKKVSPLNYDGSNTNKSRTVTIRRWFGVDINIKNRNNTLLVIAKDSTGKEVARKTHNIHFSGVPTSAQFLPEESTLVADGKTTPVIALRIKDEDGFPMRANTHGYFTIRDNKFQVKTQKAKENELNLNEHQSRSYKYHIKENGIAKIELNPTTQSGEIVLRLKFAGANRKDIRAWLKPKLREWIMVGLAEGTISHRILSGNMKALEDLDKADTFHKKGRISFFAKGKVKGKYLLTIAYDTHKGKQAVGSQLEGEIDPDAWYTIYADNSNNQYNAPSSSKLYLKIEKDSFFALFGDYRTTMNITELAKYERTLNGIKTEYQSKKYSYNAFISETNNKHHHDEIPGDGTSGLYHLSHNILSNSESIRIETRDRFHSERVLETKELVRYQDYQIDYEAGTLFFKFPITSRDQSFNPNIIIIDYDSETENNKEIVAGGRAAYKTDNEKLEVGISGLHIGRNQTKNDSLVAIDATYQVSPDTKLHVEIAQSKTEKSGHKSVAAEIIELEKQIANMEARIYYRKHDENFGIDSQASESGIEKTGAELTVKIDKKTKLNAEVSHQKNVTDESKRLLAEVDIDYKIKQIDIRGGLRHTQEKFADNLDTTNNTVLLGAKYTTDNGKVSLRSNIEKNINNNNNSEISPDKVVVGVDVKLQQGLILFAEHEVTNNKETTTHNSRVGISKDLWKGAKAKTTLSKERTDEGQRNYATLGLSQRLNLTDKIKADISVDHAKTIGEEQKRFNENEPKQQGNTRDDFTAFSVGLGANEEEWTWTSRFEIRKGDHEDKINFTAGIIRHLDNGKQLSGKVSYYDSEMANGDTKVSNKLSFGTAWHPNDNDFVFFSRLDLIDEKSKILENDSTNKKSYTRKVVHNLHYNRKIDSKTQVSVHHGIKHVIDRNSGIQYKATIDTATIELRRDINSKWDIGVKGGYLRDWTENTTETVAGISVGMTPAKNAWIELGYNVEGFDDEDFDDNSYKHKGPYASFRYKFDQNSLKEKDLPIRNKKNRASEIE